MLQYMAPCEQNLLHLEVFLLTFIVLTHELEDNIFCQELDGHCILIHFSCDNLKKTADNLFFSENWLSTILFLICTIDLISTPSEVFY